MYGEILQVSYVCKVRISYYSTVLNFTYIRKHKAADGIVIIILNGYLLFTRTLSVNKHRRWYNIMVHADLEVHMCDVMSAHLDVTNLVWSV